MKLRRIRVDQWRQFRTPLTVDGLAPGINLFSGPNEAGKSTLVQAIRAAFFERHRSSSVDDLQPWDDSAAAPSIDLEFDWQGQRWHLSKRFLKQKRCDVRIGAQTFSGDDAEEQLADLLGYQSPKRGASKAEHWGIPGLLWIEQGAGHMLQDAVKHAGDQLKSVLHESLGEVASTTGDELITRVERERAKLLTPSASRPTGDYAKAQQEYEALEAECAALQDKIAHYQQQVDRLDTLRQQQQEDKAAPWQTYRQRAATAQAQLEAVAHLERAQQEEHTALQHAQTQATLYREQRAAFERQHEALAYRARTFQEAATALATDTAQREAVVARQAQQQAAYQQARTAVLAARAHEQRAQRTRELAQCAQTLNELTRHHERATALNTALIDKQREWHATRVDAAQLKALQHHHRDLNALQVAQQATATRLHFTLKAGQHLRLGDETLDGQGERRLLAATDLHIAGVGVVRIQPGGEDVAAQQRHRQTLEDAMAALCSTLHVTDLADAEARAERADRLAQDIAHTQTLLETFAPDGLDALRLQLDTCQQQHQNLTAQCAALPEEDTAAVPLGVASAEAAMDVANERLQHADQAVADVERACSLKAQALQAAQQEHDALAADVQAPDRTQRQHELAALLHTAEANVTALNTSMAARQQAIDDALPDQLRQDIERFERSADTLEAAAHERERETMRLQASLEALGAEGLEERLAGLDQTRQFTQRRRDELARRAGALDMLLNTLRDKRQALTQRLQAPLQKHLSHYLNLLFPQAQLHVDSDLTPVELLRTVAGQTSRHAVEALSFGAREQMGLISRLAYADLLQAAGRPTLIILDDALVHSDRTRLEQMKRILFDASQRHQVLLFTCHPEHWQDLGAPARDLDALKLAAG